MSSAAREEPIAYDEPMDVNIVEDKPDTDFEALVAAMQRDEREQVRDANREIL